MQLKACCNNSGELTDAQMSGWRPDACLGKVCIHPDGIARRYDLSVNSLISLANHSALRLAYRIEMLIMCSGILR